MKPNKLQSSKVVLIFTIVFFLYLPYLMAQTQVSGTISGQTWTPAGSPYLVVGNINVASLQIQPGVTVLFDGDFVFEVTGVLTAVGTAQDSIIFTKNTTASGWQGILFNFVTPASELAYCRVSFSKNSGVRLVTSLPKIRNCTFTNNSSTTYGGGVFVGNGSIVSFSNCMFSNNSTKYGGGINTQSGGTTTLTNCVLINNSASYYGGGLYNSGTANLVNCTIAFNSYFGINRSSGSNVIMKNSIIYFNDYQISSGVIVTYCDVQGGFSGSGNIDANPVFDNPSKLTIWEFSPCVDTGDPDSTFFDVCFPPSHGTERNDMGAYGGGGACNWNGGLPPASLISVSIDTLYANRGDTILVPIKVVFPTSLSVSSAEISIGGYIGSLQLMEIVTASSLAGDAGWAYQANETDSLSISWFAGAEDISGEGVFFWLKFIVPDIASGFIPITLKSAIFDKGDISANLSSGGVNIHEIFYGDVDLNGMIQAFDASLILKYLVGKETLTVQQLLNANVSLDATVSSLDATLILQLGVGLIDTLPYDTTMGRLSASGNIEMANQGIQAGQSIDIPLVLTNGDNILSFDGRIVFNSEHLIFNGVVWSGMLNGFIFQTNNDGGEIKFAGAGTIPDGEAGVFATLKFTVSNEADEDDVMEVSLQRLRWNEQPVMEGVAKTTLTVVTGVETNHSEIPTEFALNNNYPNPFNPTTTIAFSLPRASEVTLKIYNIRGEEVATLVAENLPPGNYRRVWSAGDLSSGVYFCRLQAGDFVATRKLILIR